MVHFWIKKKKKKKKTDVSYFFFFSKRHVAWIRFSCERVMTGYLSRSSSMVTRRIPRDVMLLPARGGERKDERKKERAKETVTYGVSEWPQVKGLVQPRYIIVRELWTASWLRH